MSFIMNRRAAIAWGVVDSWPKDAAALTDAGGRCSNHGRRFVSWTEVHEERRRLQTERLRIKREVADPTRVPCYVWAFHNDWDFPYGGWWTYVVTLRDQIAVNFRGMNSELALSIMRSVPCGLFPVLEDFDDWMVAFARDFPRRKHPNDPRTAGSIVGWLVNEQEFRRLTREESHGNNRAERERLSAVDETG